MTPENLKYLIATHRGLHLSATRFEKLRGFFNHDWEHIFKATEDELYAAQIDVKSVQKFLEIREKIKPDLEMERLKKCEAEVLVRGEEDFPHQLEHIPSPPSVLFVRGKILASDFPSVSVVGSRKVSQYGQRAIQKIIGEIAAEKITIVSGGALGTDFCAHKTAITNKARTLVCLGNGIDEIYPGANKRFLEEIVKTNQGAIISEYLPGAPVKPENFPVRNRIISGLSKVIIVIEAAERSGSLITAQMALDQGRELFVVPGEIFSPTSKGTNKLLFSGANPALSGKEILEMSGFKNLAQKQKIKTALPKNKIEADILQLFEGDNKIHINDIIRRTNLGSSVTSANISILELKGFLRNLGNGMFTREF